MLPAKSYAQKQPVAAYILGSPLTADLPASERQILVSLAVKLKRAAAGARGRVVQPENVRQLHPLSWGGQTVDAAVMAHHVAVLVALGLAHIREEGALFVPTGLPGGGGIALRK